MYWENGPESRLIFSKNSEPVAKKEHECCECGKTIKIGEKYSYFVGCWNDDGNQFGTYKTCSECEKDWNEILDIFHANREHEALRVFGSLEEAVQDAFDAGFLTESDQLIKEWLDIEPEVDIDNLSPEKKEEYERQEAVVQMRMYSRPLL